MILFVYHEYVFLVREGLIKNRYRWGWAQIKVIFHFSFFLCWNIFFLQKKGKNKLMGGGDRIWNILYWRLLILLILILDLLFPWLCLLTVWLIPAWLYWLISDCDFSSYHFGWPHCCIMYVCLYLNPQLKWKIPTKRQNFPEIPLKPGIIIMINDSNQTLKLL